MKTYRNGERQFGEEGKKKFVRSGEFREPKKGEWYISGAQPVAYQAKNDLGTEFYIAQPVAYQAKNDLGTKFYIAQPVAYQAKNDLGTKFYIAIPYGESFEKNKVDALEIKFAAVTTSAAVNGGYTKEMVLMALDNLRKKVEDNRF